MGNQVRPTSKARKARDSPPNWHKARLVMIRISFFFSHYFPVWFQDLHSATFTTNSYLHIDATLFTLLSSLPHFFVITRYFLFSLRPDAFGCHCISIFLPCNRSIGDRAGLGTRDVVMNDWAWFGFRWVWSCTLTGWHFCNVQLKSTLYICISVQIFFFLFFSVFGPHLA